MTIDAGADPQGPMPGPMPIVDLGDLTDLRRAVGAAIDAAGEASSGGPRSPISPAELRTAIGAMEICPDDGRPFDEVVADLGRTVFAHGIDVSHAATAAHLHPSPLVPAVATEVAIAATNQSLDAWDGGPAATVLELALVDWLAANLGLGGAPGS